MSGARPYAEKIPPTQIWKRADFDAAPENIIPGFFGPYYWVYTREKGWEKSFDKANPIYDLRGKIEAILDMRELVPPIEVECLFGPIYIPEPPKGKC
jgi:hypothetical protein